MNGRLIAIGDIHGCHQEFAELLERLSLTKDDRLVLLGDLVNRGPDSCRVIDLAKQHHALSLLGNHELRLLNYRRTREPYNNRDADAETFAKLRPEDWTYLEAMPLTHYVDELNTVFVHGGFLPNEPWQRQPASVITASKSWTRMANQANAQNPLSLPCGPICGTARPSSFTATPRGPIYTSSSGPWALTPPA